MQYCSNCGAAVEGRFCAKCGTAVGAATAAPPPPPGSAFVPAAQGLGLDENLAAALCYIPLVGLIFLLVDPYKQNRIIRFHAWQSLLYFVAFLVLRIGLWIVWGMLEIAMPYGFAGLWSILMSLVGLAFFAGLVLLVVKAFQRERFLIPVIGPIAERQV